MLLQEETPKLTLFILDNSISSKPSSSRTSSESRLLLFQCCYRRKYIFILWRWHCHWTVQYLLQQHFLQMQTRQRRMRSTNTPARTPATHNGTAFKKQHVSTSLYYKFIDFSTVDMKCDYSETGVETCISMGNEMQFGTRTERQWTQLERSSNSKMQLECDLIAH
jgi:hypothetical protein